MHRCASLVARQPIRVATSVPTLARGPVGFMHARASHMVWSRRAVEDGCSPAPGLPRLVSLVRRFGGSVSHALVSPGVDVFSVDEIEGAIAYRHGFGCAVAIGNPSARASSRGRSPRGFVSSACDAAGTPCMSPRTVRLRSGLRDRGCATVEFGAELIMDPRVDPTAGAARSRLRGKVNRALHGGTTAMEYRRARARQPLLEREMGHVVEAWLGARQGPQVYLAPFRPFDASTSNVGSSRGVMIASWASCR